MIDAEEIRRVIAWQLCGTMPPSDETLRTIYADYVSLESLGVDSLDRVELGMTLEEKFSIAEVTQDENAQWSTVGDVIRFVQSKLS
jgi:acyl carrier protein